ncbi:hypothetical protein BD626DRAFT_634002 [Schizophyllum amplum]|uniref:DUF7918 domain-containing protein n=1 Tax=Schizophyllum amplum TaxID=97359 RepID=A0A550C1A7_9AGAR|nr:hypothetical protein BD626DRAFT_634002 [Auriculariopsis ampla]
MNSLRIDQFTAWIETDGVALPVYDATTDAAGKSATAWIASEAGKSFIVCWQDTACAFDIVGKATVDGHKCGSAVRKASSGRSKITLKGVRVSDICIRPFVFAPLALTDDDRYLDVTLNGLGDICLKIHHVKNLVRTPFVAMSGQSMEAPKVHERAKKAGGHHVQLGTQTRTHKYRRTTFEKVAQVAEFTFHYRPLDQVDEPGDAARIRELESELAALRGHHPTQHAQRPAQHARAETGGAVKREVKREGDTSLGEVIDLTEVKREEHLPIHYAADGAIDLTLDD